MGDTEHPYFNARKEIKEEDRVRGLVVITGDKGLAGAYNHNVLKLAHEWMEKVIKTVCMSWESWEDSILLQDMCR